MQVSIEISSREAPRVGVLTDSPVAVARRAAAVGGSGRSPAG